MRLLFVGQTLWMVQPPARTPAQHLAVDRQGKARLEVPGGAANRTHQGIAISSPLVASSTWHVLLVVLGEAVDEDPSGHVSWGVAEHTLVDDEAWRSESSLDLAAANVVAIESLADAAGEAVPLACVE
ncbi:hypothetical protein ACFPIJ_44050 [Dactylosporangium cerinum]|uniref:Uncharacterized protein n=1 Tax=Dactylosporangium cerinum TaxID=1434730 RepID=A0ABV9WBW6_9ACTN